MTTQIGSTLRALVLGLGLLSPVAHAEDGETYSDAELAGFQAMAELWSAMNPQTGSIALGDDLATLTVPDSYYYLDAMDSRRVLVDLWGNPPETADVMGMLFPENCTPLDGECWAVTIEYVADGHVADEDASSIDYDELLESMRSDLAAGNGAREVAGYEPIELIGWAEPPHYDAHTKQLYWAKTLRFGDSSDTTLNYDIRTLGRRGVLSMTFVASTAQLPQINASLNDVLAMAAFNDGQRYADFDSNLDEIAAYGIGGLIAGKVAAKAGLLAAGLLFLKKFGVFVLFGVGALGRKLLGVFRRDEGGPQNV